MKIYETRALFMKIKFVKLFRFVRIILYLIFPFRNWSFFIKLDQSLVFKFRKNIDSGNKEK